MRTKLQKYLGNPLAPKYRAGFSADLFRSFFKPTVLVGTLIILFEITMIISTLVRPGIGQSPERQVYLALYILLLVVTGAAVGGAVIFRKALKRNPGRFIALCIVYAAVICVWGSFLSAYAHRHNDNISVFLYVTLFVAIVVTLRPWQAILLFGGNQAVFLLLLRHYAGAQVNIFGSVINSLITTLLCIVITSVLYHSRAKDYLNRTIIMQQNREISNINDQLRQLVYLDDLTKAGNRRYLDEVLPEKLEGVRKARKSICVMMFDLDYFKQYNDLYGHQAGDRCLVSFAGVVHRFLAGKAGALVRYGGEEFLLCLEGYDEKTGVAAAEEIRTGLERLAIPHREGVKDILTVSTGVRVSPPGETVGLDKLVSDADEALYIAKNAGRDRVKLYYPAL